MSTERLYDTGREDGPAAVTERLRLCTGVLIVPLRPAALLVEQDEDARKGRLSFDRGEDR